MTPEQENQLFQSIGQIQATQDSILEGLSQIRDDVNKRLDKVEERVDQLDEKYNERMIKVEEKVTNLRLKVAGYGGAAGFTVYLVSELLRSKMGG
jgi:uncharacterized FlaG/YvyC family protein